MFPSWWFSQHPASSVIIASHSTALASYFSRRIQLLIAERSSQLGFAVSGRNRSVDAWSTTAGGEFLATGIRSGLAGRRADLIVVDDPIGSQAEADSAGQRERLWEWFKADLITRLRPGGKVVLIMTRWHPDDLAGRLMSQASSEWRAIRLPALAEADDPLGRAEGAPLWPEWESREALLRKRDMVGERTWSALFQQRPRPATGKLFAIKHLAVVDIKDCRQPTTVVRAWDLAATGADGKNDPDWTAGVKLGLLPDGRYIIMDVTRIRGTAREVEELILATARRDGTDVVIGVPEDPGQAGKSQRSYLTRQLTGFIVIGARETGSKATRALPLASQIEAGNVVVASAPWNHALFDELQEFPFGRKDDQVDALVRAFVTINEMPQRPRQVQTAIFQR